MVTSFVFRLLPAPAATNLRLTWPAADAAALIDAWQRWAPTAPDELAASLLVKDVGEADQPPTVELIGAMLGTEADADELLGEFVARAGCEPTTVFRQHMSWRETRRFWAELGGAGSEVVRHGYRVNKSEYFQQILPIEAITAVVARLRDHGRSRPVPRARLLALGRRLQPGPPRLHRLRPPRPALPAEAHRRREPRRVARREGSRPSTG